MRTLWSLAVTVLASSVSATDYYVNGVIGRDVLGFGTGLSAANPWKTMQYALLQIPPIASPAFHVLRVAGSQSYGIASNGEMFPIRLPPNVRIVGDNVKPVCVIPTGYHGFQFDATVTHDRDTSWVESMAFQGGAVGISLGSLTTRRHRPTLTNIEFRGQTVAGIELFTSSGSVDDPLVSSCTFTDCAHGLLGRSLGNAVLTGGALSPIVVDCRFLACALAGVKVTGDPGYIHATLLLSGCTFHKCGEGVTFLPMVNLPTTKPPDPRITSCHFADCPITAIRVSYTQSSTVELTIMECTFVNSGVALTVDGSVYPIVSHRIAFTRNYVTRCGAGMSCSPGLHQPQASDLTLVSTSNVIERCTGAALSASLGSSIESTYDRFVNNGGAGLSLSGPPFARLGSCIARSSIYAGNKTGVSITSPAYGFSGAYVTVCDNTDYGLFIDAAPIKTIINSIISNNGTEVSSASPAIFYSCLTKQSYPGTGNLGMTDPRLQRPFYKLTRQSPCIDKASTLALPTLDYEGDPRAWSGNAAGPSDMGADEYYQPGAARSWGAPGFGPLDFVPRIGSPSNSVGPGQILTIDLRNARDRNNVAAGTAVLLLGLTESSAPLPTDLAVIGAVGSFLYQEMAAIGPAIPVAPAGTAAIMLTIPNNPLLIGGTFTGQWIVTKAGANQAGLVTTDALRVSIGG